MKHAYILEQGKWTASGAYYGEAGNSLPVRGETEIVHREGIWVLDGFMELALAEPVRFQNTYAIEPLAQGRDFTFWTSTNPALGTLRGSFMFVGHAILSSYRSDCGQYSGTESLVMLDRATYESRGFAFHKKAKLSSWEVTLRRVS